MTRPPSASTKRQLDDLVVRYEQADFIERDPISVPHAFDSPADQEIIGLYSALLAWGRRDTLLEKLSELCSRMAYQPYEFVRHFREHDPGALEGFYHRTFQPEDAFWLTSLLSEALHRHGSLNSMFYTHLDPGATDVGAAIQAFSEELLSFDPDVPSRLRKHLPRPEAGSACKRFNLYLRWMVRPGPVDLGIWEGVSPAQLVLPLDVHSRRMAMKMGLLRRNANDWKAAMELTENCRAMCPGDPVRYDFALFGPGAQ